MALYSIGYIARYYGVSPSTIRRWEASGKIPASIRTIGGHRRFEQNQELFASHRLRRVLTDAGTTGNGL